jgi:hypothetical protein
VPLELGALNGELKLIILRAIAIHPAAAAAAIA